MSRTSLSEVEYDRIESVMNHRIGSIWQQKIEDPSAVFDSGQERGLDEAFLDLLGGDEADS